MELEVFVSAELSLEALVGALEQQRLPSNLPTDRLQALLARASTLLRERMADEDGGMGEEEQGQTPRAGSARGARRQIGSARDNRLNRRRAPSIGFTNTQPTVRSQQGSDLRRQHNATATTRSSAVTCTVGDSVTAAASRAVWVYIGRH